jgi:hypothetical protein
MQDLSPQHLLIPFAFCSSAGCRQALTILKLPHLEKLLPRLTPEATDTGDVSSLSPPHERALARALDLPVKDGLIPWAAWQAHEADSAWAFITPCHWQTSSRQVAMSAEELPDFTAQESQTLLAAMQPYFAEDAIVLRYDQATRWLACGDAFKGLATASLDRVAGCSVATWLPHASSAIALQRLQGEMQMLLYNHPVNDAREARGVATVNSFWISGTGPHPCPLPQAVGANAPTVVATLRAAALAQDWSAWVSAWQVIDATVCQALLSAQARGESVQITLCGERNAQTFVAKPQSIRHRVINFFGNQQAACAVLERL